jgi:tryptophan synthase beta chain
MRWPGHQDRAEMGKDQIIVMNLCGRGDKDVFTVGKILGVEL